MCQICVPVTLFFPAPAPLRAVPLSCTLPTLFASRDTSRESQKPSVTKSNLMPWQPQGRFSELLQQLWPGLEAIWFCRGWDGIYSSHISDCGDLISRALSCWHGWLDSTASCLCPTCARYFLCMEKSFCIIVAACHNYKHCSSVVTI